MVIYTCGFRFWEGWDGCGKKWAAIPRFQRVRRCKMVPPGRFSGGRAGRLGYEFMLVLSSLVDSSFGSENGSPAPGCIRVPGVQVTVMESPGLAVNGGSFKVACKLCQRMVAVSCRAAFTGKFQPRFPRSDSERGDARVSAQFDRS
jgi:hypothetical protein